MKLVLLHALPFDGHMWDNTSSSTIADVIAPSLFGRGESIQEWAAGVLRQVGSDDLIVVGASVGGSCALEVASAAPEQVAAIVLVGAKAGVNPEPSKRDHALRVLKTKGMEGAWEEFWLPLFAPTTSDEIKERARSLAMEQDVSEIAAGVTAFHDRRDLSAFASSWTKPLIGISGEHDFTPLSGGSSEECARPRSGLPERTVVDRVRCGARRKCGSPSWG